MMPPDELREFVLSLPEVEEIDTWKEGHPTFRVRDKIFVTLSTDNTSAGIKASLEEQEELLKLHPETFAVAPYTGRFGWVIANLATAEPELMRAIIVKAWRRTAPKRLVTAYDMQNKP